MAKCAKSITIGAHTPSCVRREGHKGLHRAYMAWGTITINLPKRGKK